MSKDVDYFDIGVPKIKSLRDIALETLRDAIIMGHINPGEHLKERELSEKMGISTTPIKEAIRILSYEGLVESIPRKGNFVSEFVDSSIEEILFLRAKLEGFAAKLAAEKMTTEEINILESYVNRMESKLAINDLQGLADVNNEFHEMIRSSTRNPLIYNMLMNLAQFDYSFRKRALSHYTEVEIGVKEHRLIFEAIKDRNPLQAEQRITNHIERSARAVLQNANKQPKS